MIRNTYPEIGPVFSDGFNMEDALSVVTKLMMIHLKKNNKEYLTLLLRFQKIRQAQRISLMAY